MRKYIVTGLLIWVPLVITIWVLNLIVTTMDQTLQLLPERWQRRVELLIHALVGLFGALMAHGGWTWASATVSACIASSSSASSAASVLASSSASRHSICCIRKAGGMAVLFSACTGAPRSSHR